MLCMYVHVHTQKVQDYEIPQEGGGYVGIRDSGSLLTFCVPITFMKIMYNKWYLAGCLFSYFTNLYVCCYDIRPYLGQDAQSGEMGWKPAKRSPSDSE